MTRPAAALASLLVLAGCSEDLDPASLITKGRVLAARVEVQGEPERAWPAPGETATFRFRVVHPDVLPPMAWAFLACAPLPTLFGGGACDGTPFFLETQLEPTAVDGEIRVSFEVPADFAGPELLVLGAVCFGGAVNLPSPTAEEVDVRGCSDPALTGTLLTMLHPVQRDDATNHQPALAELSLNGTSWAADTAGAACGDPGLPELRVGADDAILHVRASEGSRERYVRTQGDAEPEEVFEELQISSFTEAGKLERTFSFADDEAGEDHQIEVDWRLPEGEDVPAEGRAVDFHFVVRDLRGGADWTSRTLCMRP